MRSPLRVASRGFGSKRSTWDGPPDMNRKMTRLAFAIGFDAAAVCPPRSEHTAAAPQAERRLGEKFAPIGRGAVSDVRCFIHADRLTSLLDSKHFLGHFYSRVMASSRLSRADAARIQAASSGFLDGASCEVDFGF